jgi:hypothetical protein
VLRSWHGARQLGFFIAMLEPVIQLALNHVDLILLIGERFTSVVDENRLAETRLSLRDLAIEIEPALLQLLRRPFSIG